MNIQSIQPRFGVSPQAWKRHENQLALEKRLMELPMAGRLKIGDPALGPVDFPVAGLGQIFEIAKCLPPADLEESWDTKFSCEYLLSVYRKDAASPQNVVFNNKTLSEVRLTERATSLPDYLLRLGNIFTIRLPQHYG